MLEPTEREVWRGRGLVSLTVWVPCPSPSAHAGGHLPTDFPTPTNIFLPLRRRVFAGCRSRLARVKGHGAEEFQPPTRPSVSGAQELVHKCLSFLAPWWTIQGVSHILSVGSPLRTAPAAPRSKALANTLFISCALLSLSPPHPLTRLLRDHIPDGPHVPSLCLRICFSERPKLRRW